MTIDINVFIVLSIPTFVVNVKQILSVMGFDYHFDGGFAPYVFCVAGVNLFTGFDRIDYVTLDPFVVGLHSFIPSEIIGVITFLFFAIGYHFYRVVDQQRWLKDLTSNVFSTLWALLFSNHAFSYAMMAKRVTTYRYTATNNIIHTDRTRQSLNFSHRRIRSFLLIVNFIFQSLHQLFFRRNLWLLYNWSLFWLNWFT